MPAGQKDPLWYGLAARLLAIREAQKMTAVALASLSSQNAANIRQIERGLKRVPGIDTIERLAAALGVSPCWLAFGVEGEDVFRQRIFGRTSPPALPESQGPLCFEARYAGCPERLQSRRLHLGLSKGALGSGANVSGQQIGNIERHKYVPGVDSAFRLAVALDVAPCWLAYGMGARPSVNKEANSK